MWHRLFKGIKKNAVWLILLVILLIPDLRIPIQIWFNKGFSHINWVQVSEEQQDSNLQDLIVLDQDNSRLMGTALTGKVVFVNNWATWCPPCIAEMPGIQDLYNDYQDKVEFVLISNESFDIMNRFIASKNFTLPLYQPIHLPDNLQSNSIPTTFIIDGLGNVVVKKSGAVNWNSADVRSILDDLLKKAI